MADTPTKHDDDKDPLDITDLPVNPDDAKDVTGGVFSRRAMLPKDSCNSNTLTCKDTSTTNTLCCE